jgi:hypothetical protein
MNIFRRRQAEVVVERFVCQFCDKVFETKAELRGHLVGAHSLQRVFKKESVLYEKAKRGCGKRWTAKEEKELKLLWGSYKAKEIALIMNRSVSSVQSKVEKLQNMGVLVEKSKQKLLDIVSLVPKKEVTPIGEKLTIEELWDKLPEKAKFSKGVKGFVNAKVYWNPVIRDYNVKFRGEGLRETIIKFLQKIEEYNRKKLW